MILSQMDGPGRVFTSCQWLVSEVGLYSKLQMSRIEQRKLPGQAQGSMCETQVRLTNLSLELKFYLLRTIYTKSLTQKES